MAAEELSTIQIILSIGGSGGLVITVLTVAKYISERLDLKSGKKEKEQALALEKSRDNYAEVWKLVDAKQEEIVRLNLEIKALEEDNKLSRPVVRDIYRTLTLLEARAKALRVAQCPPEVVDVINERINEFLAGIGEARDLLP